MQEANSISDLITNNEEFIECYISTNANEVIQYLLEADVIEHKGSTLIEKNEKRPISFEDIALERARYIGKILDFTPMSKFVLDVQNVTKLDKLLYPLTNPLFYERHYMTFVNKSETLKYTVPF